MSTLPTPEALRRQRLGLLDLVVILGVLLLLGWIGRVGTEALVQFHPPEITPSISLDPWQLPDYASRSMLRMLVALFCSTVFSVAYGSLAAHRPWAEKVLIPLLDILQGTSKKSKQNLICQSSQRSSHINDLLTPWGKEAFGTNRTESSSFSRKSRYSCGYPDQSHGDYFDHCLKRAKRKSVRSTRGESGLSPSGVVTPRRRTARLMTHR